MRMSSPVSTSRASRSCHCSRSARQGAVRRLERLGRGPVSAATTATCHGSRRDMGFCLFSGPQVRAATAHDAKDKPIAAALQSVVQKSASRGTGAAPCGSSATTPACRRRRRQKRSAETPSPGEQGGLGRGHPDEERDPEGSGNRPSPILNAFAGNPPIRASRARGTRASRVRPTRASRASGTRASRVRPIRASRASGTRASRVRPQDRASASKASVHHRRSRVSASRPRGRLRKDSRASSRRPSNLRHRVSLRVRRSEVRPMAA